MKKIGLLSDTHGSLPDGWIDFLDSCDEIWHAGDFGNEEVADRLTETALLRGVFGNIDGTGIRERFHETEVFLVEQLKVVMMHIGGYPGKYTRLAYHLIKRENPGMFISGHSHILKVIYDQSNGLLHVNPGAAGKSGLHRKITMVRFFVDGKEIRDMEVFEKDR